MDQTETRLSHSSCVEFDMQGIGKKDILVFYREIAGILSELFSSILYQLIIYTQLK